MDRRCVPLAFFALSSELLAVFDHSWPVITVAFYFDCERSSAGMVSARPGMDLLHYSSRFFAFTAGHEWAGESPFVDFSFYHYVSCGLGLNFAGRPFLGGKRSVDYVCSDRFQPRAVAAVFRLIHVFFWWVVYFLRVFDLCSNKIGDHWQSDAWVFNELDGDYPTQSRIRT